MHSKQNTYISYLRILTRCVCTYDGVIAEADIEVFAEGGAVGVAGWLGEGALVGGGEGGGEGSEQGGGNEELHGC